MGERDHTLGLGEANGVGVRAVFVRVVTSLAIVAILACRAIPDSVGRVDLSAKATAVREWEGSGGAAGRCIIVVVLGHGKPPEVVVASVFYSCG